MLTFRNLDANNIVSACSFSSTSYTPATASLVGNVSVSPARAAAIATGSSTSTSSSIKPTSSNSAAVGRETGAFGLVASVSIAMVFGMVVRNFVAERQCNFVR